MRLQRFVVGASALVGISILPPAVFAETPLSVQVSTGVDDLRGGNTAFINLILLDGRVLTEQVLTRSGLASGSTSTILITFPETVTATQIRSIRIRHDGSPRSGEPFDTYDNWNLKGLRVNFQNTSELLYNSSRDSRFPLGGDMQRFTGASRQLVIPIRPIGTEPDFIITRVIGSPSGLNVTVKNVGLGEGGLTNVSCSTVGRTISTSTTTRLTVGGETSVRVSFVPSGRITCSPTGVDSGGNPERVTANNNYSRTFP